MKCSFVSLVLSICLSVSCLGISRSAVAAPSKTKVYVLTSTYGIMAGTLTGLASLAFYNSPGDHLRNVAVGASLGLYMGVLLGTYLIYFQPDPNAPKTSPSSPSEGGDEGEIEEEASYIQPKKFVPILGVNKSGSPVLGLQFVF